MHIENIYRQDTEVPVRFIEDLIIKNFYAKELFFKTSSISSHY